MASALSLTGCAVHAGFDAEEFTSRAGGKAEACKDLKQKFGYVVVAMVGDGATDAEARCEGGADIFVCYGGVVFRENVAAEADWVVMELQALASALES
jgi:phosphoserine phosphatase